MLLRWDRTCETRQTGHEQVDESRTPPVYKLENSTLPLQDGSADAVIARIADPWKCCDMTFDVFDRSSLPKIVLVRPVYA